MTSPRLLAVALACAPLLTLTACASAPHVPREVLVPVVTPCIAREDIPPPPRIWTETELLALDEYRRTHAAWASLRAARAWAKALESLIETCARDH